MPTAVVTGANRGIGLQLGLSLRKLGFNVIATARDPQRAASLEAELRAAPGAGTVAVLALDTADAAVSVPRFLAELRQLLPSIQQQQQQKEGGATIDVLINNAAIAPDAWDADVFAAVVATNVKGPVALARALLPLLSDGAAVINVSSGYGQLEGLSPHYRDAVQSARTVDEVVAALRFVRDDPIGQKDAAAYRVSKAALNRITQLLPSELAAQREGEGEGPQKVIHVRAVCPGWCRTDMGTAAAPRSAEDGASSVLQVVANPKDAPLFTRDGQELSW